MEITYDSWMDIVAAILLVLGTLLSAVAGFGLLRFPDVLSRMHAATKPQVLGLFLALAGLGFALKTWVVVPVLIVAWLMQLITAPVSAHLVGRATYRSHHLDPAHIAVDDLAKVIYEQERADAETDAEDRANGRQ
ncbi:monovalent cation/H(+) antiporter subunit G [Enteractinococcus coprophilus]|uniref:Multisubunit sodium/proton antiporter MrpG subunit n=1 Tax=Enteractinococcus coprophilus TaxID=1027633 RepID=A0A543AMA1_9MICC|nr:monovalent cation/H(+) antiporter subunit G [Enteractinococcus coprophilus]TQL73692.1 multisubunit sodium/proton antiporter MrpG subunit [Enteractinococcus coprophilus]